MIMFVLDRALKHVAERSLLTGKTPSPFLSRIAYEQTLGAAFKSTWQENKAMGKTQRTEEAERPSYPVAGPAAQGKRMRDSRRKRRRQSIY